MSSEAHLPPSAAMARQQRAQQLAGEGLMPEAINELRSALALDPALEQAWGQLADLLLRTGDFESADIAADNHRIMESVTPRHRTAAVDVCAGELDRAEQMLAADSRVDSDATSLRLLAEIALRRRRPAEAVRLLTRSVQLQSGDRNTFYALARALHDSGQYPAAIELLRNLLARDPADAAATNLLANACSAVGQHEVAAAMFARVLARTPDNPRIWIAFGDSLRALGRRQDSESAYRRATRDSPQFGEAWWSLANLKNCRFSAEEIATMSRQQARADLGDVDRLHLSFALGKALEDRGEWEESFAHYEQGNRLRRAMVEYRADATTEYVRRCTALFTREFFEARAGLGSRSSEPIFVVGLPRSGSTLVEQILASHPEVEGTSELPDLIRLARAVTSGARDPADRRYPEVLSTLDRGAWAALGDRYVDMTRSRRRTSARHFVDKMPNNWTHVGLIHLILPGAQIIDVRRSPMACCFAAYRQLFARGQPYTYDLVELGRYYRDYVSLMRHFDETLPGRVHRVAYEDLVNDTERTVRALLDACKLAFDPRCLDFHMNKRIVNSASSEQVRQPIYREGLDLWRSYERWLDPLRSTLGDLADVEPRITSGAPNPANVET